MFKTKKIEQDKETQYNKNKMIGRKKYVFLATTLIAIASLIPITTFTTTMPTTGVPLVYAQENPAGTLTGSGSGTDFCTEGGQSDITFDATYDPDTGEVLSGTIHITSANGETSELIVDGGSVSLEFQSFNLHGEVVLACGEPTPTETNLDTSSDLSGQCGDGQTFTMQGNDPEVWFIAGEWTGDADCGAAPEPEECPPGTVGTPPDCVPEEEEDPDLTLQYRNQGQCIRAANNDPAVTHTADDCREAFQNRFN